MFKLIEKMWGGGENANLQIRIGGGAGPTLLQGICRAARGQRRKERTSLRDWVHRRGEADRRENENKVVFYQTCLMRILEAVVGGVTRVICDCVFWRHGEWVTAKERQENFPDAKGKRSPEIKGGDA